MKKEKQTTQVQPHILDKSSWHHYYIMVKSEAARHIQASISFYSEFYYMMENLHKKAKKSPNTWPVPISNHQLQL